MVFGVYSSAPMTHLKISYEITLDNSVFQGLRNIYLVNKSYNHSPNSHLASISQAIDRDCKCGQSDQKSWAF